MHTAPTSEIAYNPKTKKIDSYNGELITSFESI